MNEFSGWRLRIVADSKRLGCRHCDFWTDPHRFWSIASCELRRHVKQAHPDDR